jgi:hypothetical protein
MCIGIDAVTTESFLDALSRWLTRTPLTDLATATRREPVFAWSGPTLALIATPVGRSLASRVLAREPADLVAAALDRATRAIPAEQAQAAELARAFTAEVGEGVKVRARS